MIWICDEDRVKKYGVWRSQLKVESTLWDREKDMVVNMEADMAEELTLTRINEFVIAINYSILKTEF